MERETELPGSCDDPIYGTGGGRRKRQGLFLPLMQTTCLAQNKGDEGFPEYDYLYLQEDKGGLWQVLLVDEINKFFKE